MVILHEMGDFLYELFPQAGRDPAKLPGILEDAYAIGPFKPRVQIEGNVVRIEFDEIAADRHQGDFRKLAKLCDAGDYAKARPLLDRMIVENPGVSEYHRFRGQILSDLGDQEAAVDSLIEALRWDPRNKAALLMMGNIQTRHRGNLDVALRYVREAYRIAPQDITVLNNLGALEMKQGNLVAARDLFHQVLSIHPNYVQSMYALASMDADSGDHASAVGLGLRALKSHKRNDGLGKHLLQQVLQWAHRVCDEFPSVVRDGYAAKLEIVGGKPIKFHTDSSLGGAAAASIQFAEIHGRDHHLVRYKPDVVAGAHLQMHELVHLELALEARAANCNCVIVSDGEHFAAFKKAMEPALRRLQSIGEPQENVAAFVRSVFHGLNARSYNGPIDLVIELRLFEEFPQLRPVQFLSLHRLTREALVSVVESASIEHVTPEILKAVKVYNLTLALLFEHFYGVSMVGEFKASPKERERAEMLWSEAQRIYRERQPGAEYPWLLRWADQLHTSAYFDLVDEAEYLSSLQDAGDLLSAVEEDPLGLDSGLVEKASDSTRFQENQRKIQEQQGINFAIAHHMVSAREYFARLSQPEIQGIAMEIAMLGAGGIAPEKDGYTVRSLAGQVFTGTRLLAWYYASFALALPQILPQLGLPFEKEWAWAVDQPL